MSAQFPTLLYYGCAEPTHNHGDVVHHINEQLLALCEAHEVNGILRIDCVKTPGPDRLGKVFEDARRESELASIKELLSVHDVRAIAVVGHEGCAGHPVPEEGRPEHIEHSARLVKEQTGFGGIVFGLKAAKVAYNRCDLTTICVIA